MIDNSVFVIQLNEKKKIPKARKYFNYLSKCFIKKIEEIVYVWYNLKK